MKFSKKALPLILASLFLVGCDEINKDNSSKGSDTVVDPTPSEPDQKEEETPKEEEKPKEETPKEEEKIETSSVLDVPKGGTATDEKTGKNGLKKAIEVNYTTNENIGLHLTDGTIEAKATTKVDLSSLMPESSLTSISSKSKLTDVAALFKSDNLKIDAGFSGLTSKNADDVKGSMDISFDGGLKVSMGTGLVPTTLGNVDYKDVKVNGYLESKYLYMDLSDSALELFNSYYKVMSLLMGTSSDFTPSSKMKTQVIDDSTSLPLLQLSEGTTYDDVTNSFVVEGKGTYTSYGNGEYAYTVLLKGEDLNSEEVTYTKDSFEGMTIVYNESIGIKSIAMDMNYTSTQSIDYTSEPLKMVVDATLKFDVLYGKDVTIKTVSNKDSYTEISFDTVEPDPEEPDGENTGE